MSIAQIILLALIGYSMFLALSRVFKKQSGIREIFLWMIFWIAGAVLVIKPAIAQRTAEIFGIGRGVDLVIYTAIIFSFMVHYHLLVRQLSLEQSLTKLARELALREAQKPKSPTHGS